MKNFYHGTSKENVIKILESGYFKENTYYARKLKHAIRFGGNWVFTIRANFPDKTPLGWQIIAAHSISIDSIVSIKNYFK